MKRFILIIITFVSCEIKNHTRDTNDIGGIEKSKVKFI